MTSPFDQLASKEVLALQPGQTVFVQLADPQFMPQMTGQAAEGFQITRPGIQFRVTAQFPQGNAKFWRVWNVRSIAMLRPLIESGVYQNRWIKVTRTGQGVTSDYVPVLAPEGFNPSEADLKGGPIER